MRKNNEKGITLIALVITIIVLLILAGITINLAFNNNGILKRAENAKNKTREANRNEQQMLQAIDSYIDNTVSPKFTINCRAEIVDGLKGVLYINVNEQPMTREQFLEQVIVKRDFAEVEQDILNIIKLYRNNKDDLKQLAINQGKEYSELVNELDTLIEYPIYLLTASTTKITDVRYLKDLLCDIFEVERIEEIGPIDEYSDMVAQVGDESLLLKYLIYNSRKEDTGIIRFSVIKDGRIIDSGFDLKTIDGLENGEYKIIATWGKLRTESKVNISGVKTTDWEKLSELSTEIAKDPNINSNSDKVTKTIKGDQITINVGDLKNVKYNNQLKIVRVLGFNHDILSNPTDENLGCSYGHTGTTAGISFEFVDSIGIHRMNPRITNSGGWAESEMKKIYLPAQLNLLSNASVIKEVNKTYIPTFNSIETSISQDKLWLLSCSEIFGDEIIGRRAITTEGEQYKYYTKCSDLYNAVSNYRMKPNISSARAWWIRSPGYSDYSTFCLVDINGSCNLGSADYAVWVTPGFSI